LKDSPHQLTPWLPGEAATELLRAKAELVSRESSELAAAAHPDVLDVLRELTRAMNSYYSNKIEGQGTHPLSIQRALEQDFSSSPDIARRQRLAVAHIKAERELERRIQSAAEVLSSQVAIEAHRTLYESLTEDDRRTPDGLVVRPGQFREHEIQVGGHAAPTWQSVPAFLLALDRAYGQSRPIADHLIATACLHHRLLWVHPFVDGNGRAARLQTHLALLPSTRGLWSVNRGFARRAEAYYQALASADAPRQGDLDGRGNLSQKGLVTWIGFFLDVCLDQVRFQRVMLNLDEMRMRIQALVTFLSARNRSIRQAAVLPLHHLFTAGPVSRGDFALMTGLGERNARYLISALVKEGVVTSRGSRAPLAFNLPLRHLHFLMPNLYPEANTDNLEER